MKDSHIFRTCEFVRTKPKEKIVLKSDLLPYWERGIAKLADSGSESDVAFILDLEGKKLRKEPYRWRVVGNVYDHSAIVIEK